MWHSCCHITKMYALVVQSCLMHQHMSLPRSSECSRGPNDMDAVCRVHTTMEPNCGICHHEVHRSRTGCPARGRRQRLQFLCHAQKSIQGNQNNVTSCCQRCYCYRHLPLLRQPVKHGVVTSAVKDSIQCSSSRQLLTKWCCGSQSDPEWHAMCNSSCCSQS